MESTFQSILRPLVLDAMSSYRVPGIVVAAVCGSGEVERLAVGTDADGRELAVDSSFPVASVTKLATALAVLRLVDAGELGLDDRLGKHLPDALAAQPGVTIRRLLCHTAGLPYDLDLAWTTTTPDVNWAGFARAALQTALTYPPGIRVQYSNVGYGLLGVIVERQTGIEFREFVTSKVLEPLGVEGYLGADPPRPAATVADVRGDYAGTIYEPYNTAFWRSLALPWGGLITTVDGALRIVRAFHDQVPPFLRGTTAKEAISNQTDRLPGGFLPPLVWRQCWWGLGPDLRDAKDPHWAPSSSSPYTFGHAGASGALAFVDPESSIAWAIAGTRTADNGWLLRWGQKIAATVYQLYQA